MRPAVGVGAVACLLCVWHVLAVASTSSSRRAAHFVQATPRVAFALNSDLLDWSEAVKQCRAWQSTLAFPTSPLEGEMLREFLTNLNDNTTKDIHLGFHSLFAQGDFITMQGREMDEYGYWQWDPSSLNASDQRCGAMSVSGMKTIDCATRLESVCQFQESLYYEQIDDFGYYRFHEGDRNWTDAVSVCKIEGAYLLILRSVEEHEAVYNFFSERGFINGTLDLFYGAHQLFADQLFVTLGDELVSESGYDVWAPDEPGSEPLVGVRMADVTTPDEHDAGLFAAPRDLPMPYICKRDLH